jgi:hypothetical protein
MNVRLWARTLLVILDVMKDILLFGAQQDLLDAVIRNEKKFKYKSVSDYPVL